MLNKVKGRKLDPRMVSNQKWEIQYIASKFKIKPDKVRQAKKAVGKSRNKVYKYIRENF